MTAIPGPSSKPGPRAVIFDLDETLLDRRAAWQYALEQAVALACGRRVSAARLADEYRLRPWRHALAVVLGDAPERERCEQLCEEIYQRSALKRLLVHDGLGVALDRLRGEGIEMAAISRAPHRLALNQIRSTGLDGFLASLAAAGPGDWQATECIGRCMTFLERTPATCAFVSGNPDDLQEASAMGLQCFEAGWASADSTGYTLVPQPLALLPTLREAWLA